MLFRLLVFLAVAIVTSAKSLKEMDEIEKKEEFPNLNATSFHGVRYTRARKGSNVKLSCLPPNMAEEEKKELYFQVVKGFWENEDGAVITNIASESFVFSVDDSHDLHVHSFLDFFPC